MKDLHFSDSRLGEDQIFLAKVILRKQKTSKSAGIFYHYQINRSGSLTNSNSFDRKIEIKKSLKDLGPLILKSRLNPVISIFFLRMVLTLVKESFNER